MVGRSSRRKRNEESRFGIVYEFPAWQEFACNEESINETHRQNFNLHPRLPPFGFPNVVQAQYVLPKAIVTVDPAHVVLIRRNYFGARNFNVEVSTI